MPVRNTRGVRASRAENGTGEAVGSLKDFFHTFRYFTP